jgi:hypothetical protein
MAYANAVDSKRLGADYFTMGIPFMSLCARRLFKKSPAMICKADRVVCKVFESRLLEMKGRYHLNSH